MRDELQDRANREALAADAEDVTHGREPSRMSSYPANTIAPREGEAFTQTLKRRKAKETSKVARFAAQAEKDRTRRELETLTKVRRLMVAWHEEHITAEELAVELWLVTR